MNARIKLESTEKGQVIEIEGRGVALIALMAQAIERSENFKEMIELALEYVKHENNKEDDKK